MMTMTRKRFSKLLQAAGLQRNDFEDICAPAVIRRLVREDPLFSYEHLLDAVLAALISAEIKEEEEMWEDALTDTWDD